jgi:hypothetical protein
MAARSERLFVLSWRIYVVVGGSMHKMAKALSIVTVVLASSRALPDNLEALALWKGVVSHVAETQVPWEELHDYGDHVIAISYLRDSSPTELHPLPNRNYGCAGG